MSINSRFAKPDYEKKGKIEADEIKTSKNENYFDLAPLIQTTFDLGSLYPSLDDLKRIGKIVDNVLQTSNDIIVDFNTYPEEIKKYINLYLDEDTGNVSFITIDDDGNDVVNEIIIPNNAKLDGDNLVDNDGNIKLEINKINENAQKNINLYINDDNYIYMLDEDGNEFYKIVKDNVIIDDNVLKNNDDTLLDLDKNVIKNDNNLIVNDKVILELDKNVIIDDNVLKNNDDTLLDLDKNVIYEDGFMKTDSENLIEKKYNAIIKDNVLYNDDTSIDINHSKIEPITGEIQFFIDTSDKDKCKVIFKSEKIDDTAISFSGDDAGIMDINIDTDKLETTSFMILTGIIDDSPKNVFLQFSKDDDENITKITVSVSDNDNTAIDSLVNLLWKL